MFEEGAEQAYAVIGGAVLRDGLSVLQQGPDRVDGHVLITVRAGVVELTAVDPETGLWWEVIALPGRYWRSPRVGHVSFPAPIHELDYRASGMGLLRGKDDEAVEIRLTSKEMRLNGWSVDRSRSRNRPSASVAITESPSNSSFLATAA